MTTEVNPFASTTAPAAAPFGATTATAPPAPAAAPAAPVPSQAGPADPFGTSAPGPGDDFTDATSGFLTSKDFEGRLLLVDVTGPAGTRMSKTQAGQTYEYIQCDVTVLDGAPNGKIGGAGWTVDVQMTGNALLPQIKGKVGKGGKLQLVLGRMTSGPSRVNPQVSAYWLAEPTESDRVIARAYLAQRRAAATQADPFGVH